MGVVRALYTELPLEAEQQHSPEEQQQELPPEHPPEIPQEITENIAETIPENIPEESISEKPEILPVEAENIDEGPPAPKRPRGRPKGSVTKPKDPPPPPKPPKAQQKLKPKPKPKKRQVQYHEYSSSEEELPEYVRQEVAPQRDLATQMLKLLQNHESIRSERKRQLYASWFAHH